MSRLPLLDKSEVAPDYHDIYTGMNLHKLTLHSPKLARLSRQLGDYFRKESRLPNRLCEAGILQIAYLARSAYEYSHHIKIGRAVGLSDDEIRAVAAPDLSALPELAPDLRATLEAAREIARDGQVCDATFASLSSMAPDQILDLLFVISFYSGFVRFTGSLQVEVEPDYEPYLAEFPLG